MEKALTLLWNSHRSRGHEVGGEIVAVGNQVKGLEVGNKVTADCVMACGVCYNCKEGLMPSACLNMRELGFRPDSPGGFGEYMVIEQQYVHRIPDDWSYEMGAWVETFSIGYFGVWGNGGMDLAINHPEEAFKVILTFDD